jgi:hypothetical protein
LAGERAAHTHRERERERDARRPAWVEGAERRRETRERRRGGERIDKIN